MTSIHIPFLPTNETTILSTTTTSSSSHDINHSETNTATTTTATTSKWDNKGNNNITGTNNETKTSTTMISNINEIIDNNNNNHDEEYVIVSSYNEMIVETTTTKTILIHDPPLLQQQQQQHDDDDDEEAVVAAQQQHQQQPLLPSNVNSTDDTTKSTIEDTVPIKVKDDTSDILGDDIETTKNNNTIETLAKTTTTTATTNTISDDRNDTMNCNNDNNTNNSNDSAPEHYDTQSNDDRKSEQTNVSSPSENNNITNQSQQKQQQQQPEVVKQEENNDNNNTNDTTIGPTLQSLPLDALHNIASYLTPKEWCTNFGTINTHTLHLCRIVLHRVYMHAYKCLIEIIISYKYYKQYEDTMELIAIYSKNGIPIYPYCFGHAYHTMYWKININIREQLEQIQQVLLQNTNTAVSTNTTMTNTNVVTDNNNNTTTTSTVNTNTNHHPTTMTNNIDPFYDTGRINHRIGYENTYLEEKCRFYYDHYHNNSNNNNHRNNNSTTTTRNNNNNNHDRDMNDAALLNHGTNGTNHHRRSPVTTTATNSSSSNVTSTGNNITTGINNNNNKVPILVHQHLYDRHYIHHEYYIDIQNGTMNTPSINLSADFFHPYIQPNHRTTTNNNNNTNGNKKKKSKKATSYISTMNTQRIQQSLDQAEHDILSLGNVNFNENDIGLATDTHDNNLLMLQESDDTTSTVSAIQSINWPSSIPQINQVTDESTELASLSMMDPVGPNNTSNSIVELCNVDVYSLSTMMSDTNNTNLQELRKHLLSRFTTYERRLETFLSKGDIYAYEECILDIWDEFFPHTAGIHYYDLETPVPRISNMHKFLTKPCPKAIGTIQCEIERIKITTRGKGMKGRLFPTYEYRLFIRHRPLPTTSTTTNNNNNNNPNDPEQDDNPSNNASDHDNNTNNNNDFVRRDTVLMVAKNRGRKYTEHSGIIPLSTSATKKGSNNYYLYMAQQMDIDDHFRNCNAHLIEQKKYNTKMEPNGASRYPVMMMDSNHSNNSNDTTMMMGSNRLLGRLQSNFIGTEFQIFTPRVRKVQHGRKLMDDSNTNALCPPFHSDDEFEYDSGVSSDYNATTPTTTIRRTSRFGRFRRNNGTSSSDGTTTTTGTPITSLVSTQPHFSTTHSDSGSVASTPIIEHRTMHRTLSSPENLLSYYHQPVTQQRHSRISRRAIANDNNSPPGPLSSPLASLSSPPPQQQSSLLLFEEEAGVITYTANLLGSRPRIMDVCIPKVTIDGVVGTEWRQYIESCYENDTMDDCRTMLSCFRQIQHRRDNQDQIPQQLQQPPIGFNNNNNNMNVMNNQNNTNNNEVDGITGDNNNNNNSSNSSNMNLMESDYGLLALQNRPPWWNVELGSFVLNFGGRVSVASVKNFQLCNRTNQDYIMLQFGRIHGRHSFTMDFQHPLSAVQAFSIAISSLQSKISFG